jgi:hypothetical protein
MRSIALCLCDHSGQTGCLGARWARKHLAAFGEQGCVVGRRDFAGASVGIQLVQEGTELALSRL